MKYGTREAVDSVLHEYKRDLYNLSIIEYKIAEIQEELKQLNSYKLSHLNTINERYDVFHRLYQSYHFVKDEFESLKSLDEVDGIAKLWNVIYNSIEDK